MQSWGCDVPIGTVMQDHITLKKYKWNGHHWIKIEVQSSPLMLVYCELKTYAPVCTLEDEYKEKHIKRGRPFKILSRPKKTRMPSEYNLYIKKHILQNTYPHLLGKEKLKQIARDWAQIANK